MPLPRTVESLRTPFPCGNCSTSNARELRQKPCSPVKGVSDSVRRRQRTPLRGDGRWWPGQAARCSRAKGQCPRSGADARSMVQALIKGPTALMEEV